MKNRERLLRRVVGLRKRLRDGAAGVSLQAESARLRAASEERAISDELALTIDDGGERLGNGVGSEELLLFDAERIWMESQQRAATGRTQAASVEAETKRAALRDRERALRSSEKLLDRVRIAMADAESSREQKAADDRSGATVARRRS